MSRSRAIETRLEKLNPSLDEFFSSGFLTRQEVVEVARQRTHWEYRLVAKPLLLLDVQKAIEYELQLEERLKNYCAASMLNLRHRWTVQERIEELYRIGLKNLRDPREKEQLRKECVLFLQKFGRTSALSRFYGEWMVHSPTSHRIWIEAAEWTAIDQGKLDDGRALLQQALVTMGSEPTVWASAVRMEFHMVQRLLRGLLDTHHAEVRRQREAMGRGSNNNNADNLEEVSYAASSAEKLPYKYDKIPLELREENESMGSILLDLALAKAVVESALDSPACGPKLIQLLLTTAAQFPFSEDIIRFLCHEGMKRAIDVLHDTHSPQRTRIMWEKGLCDLMWNQVAVEYFLLHRSDGNEKISGIIIGNPATYLEKGGIPERADPRKRLQAVGLVLLTVCELRQRITNLRIHRTAPILSVVSSTGSSSDASVTLYMDAIEKRLAEGVCEMLDFVQRFRLLSAAALSSLACLFAAAAPHDTIISCITKHFFPSIALEVEKKGLRRKRERNPSSFSVSNRMLKEEDLAFLKSFIDELHLMTPSRNHKERQVRDGDADQNTGNSSTVLPVDAQAVLGLPPSAPFSSWPIQCFVKFIRPEDAQRHLASPTTVPTSLLPAGKVDEERIERLLVWWQSVDRLHRPLLSKNTKEAIQKVSSSKEERHKVAAKLLQETKLIPPFSNSNNTEEEDLDLLSRRNVVSYVRRKTPIALWKVYNALENMHNAGRNEELREFPEKWASPLRSPRHRRSSSDSSRSCSSDSEEEYAKPKKPARTGLIFSSLLLRKSKPNRANNRSSSAGGKKSTTFPPPQRFSSYATAGIEFLASVCRGSLNSKEEWEVVEGVCTLLCSRFASFSGHVAFTRKNMRDVIRQQGECFVLAVQGFLAEVRTRCLPTPRHALVSLILPFYEAMILEEPKVASHTALARGAYEDLLGLYSLSNHLDHYAPLLYPGPQLPLGNKKSENVSQPTCQKEFVRDLNAKDWMGYIHFERHVAKDLRRAQGIMERARRLCLAPQRLLILNHTSEVDPASGD